MVNTSTTPPVATGPSSGVARVRARVSPDAPSSPSADAAPEPALPPNGSCDASPKRASKPSPLTRPAHLASTVAW